MVAEGYRVAVHGRTEVSVEKVVSDIGRAGGVAHGFVADLQNAETTRALVGEVQDKPGPICTLVHNAATGVPHIAVEDLGLEAWRKDQSIILEAAFLLAAGVLPGMRLNRWGRIVFVSSSAALRGSFGRAACYSASKAGLFGLASQIAIEHGPYQITANVVAPSQIDTPRIRRNGRRDDANLAARGSAIPLGRVGQPRDVADTIRFLCSDAARYLIGVTLPLDGGSRLAVR